MYQTISKNMFHEAFEDIRPDNFTFDGLDELFDYLEGYEDETGKGVELDVIALCCDFTEYENLEEFQGCYDGEYESIEDIEAVTSVIRVGDDGFIIHNF